MEKISTDGCAPDGTAVARAFTTRIPLAVMIAMGVKRWENRAMMPSPAKGVCGMSCSKGSDAREYANFLAWARRAMHPAVFAALPGWERVEGWRGKMVAVCDYEASYAPGDGVWDEGYPVWWRLDNVRMLKEPFPVRGNVGMWETGFAPGRPK